MNAAITQKTMTTGDVQKTALRLPKPLHERILAAAEINGRSMNAEIVARLQETFDMDAESDEESGPTDEMLALLRETIIRLPGEVADILEQRLKPAESKLQK